MFCDKLQVFSPVTEIVPDSLRFCPCMSSVLIDKVFIKLHEFMFAQIVKNELEYAKSFSVDKSKTSAYFTLNGLSRVRHTFAKIGG